MKIICMRTGKQTYGSRDIAIREAERASHASGLSFRAYVCEHCGFWHLTSKPWRQFAPIPDNYAS